MTSPVKDATCSLPTDLTNAAREYNYTKVSDSSDQSTTLNIATTTLQNSVINLDAFGTTMNDWTCFNSLNIPNTQTIVVFKSDTSFTSGPSSGNRRLYLCMKLKKVTNDLYYIYLLSDIFTAVTPNERVIASEGGNAPADDAPMCRTFCKYTGSPKIRTLRRRGTSDEVPVDAALCEPCDNTCEVDRCDPNPCQNNGSCTDFKESYSCACTVGWKGENCTTDINECSNKQRSTMCPRHSDCFNKVGSYGCNCKNGYQDKNGDCTDVNECERKPCPEHSNCTNTSGSFMCTCWIGYVNTSMGCQAKTSSSIGWIVGVVLGVSFVALVVLVLTVVFLRKNRQSTFGVTKGNTYIRPDDHHHGNNELIEVEKKFVEKTESAEIGKSCGLDSDTLTVEQETEDEQNYANCDTVETEANEQQPVDKRQSTENEILNNSS
ncbi:unnamed protein product [Mytilus coruscus]|uniref:EGF-like domain-containing protein n=1 Tax=Mytilus coruscus TaxID=42192 RepID=A0A6J8B887_MYTCO|nr:unnamed protein product [Mytilus coruscus]